MDCAGKAPVLRTEAQRVDVVDRRTVEGECVESGVEAERIRAYPSARGCIPIAVTHAIEPGLFVVIVTLKADGDADRARRLGAAPLSPGPEPELGDGAPV